METITFKKSDFWASLVIGEICAWLIFALAKGLLPAEVYAKFFLMLALLPIIVPILCAIGVYVAFLLSKRMPVLFQIGKFGIVGVLNTLIDWGVVTFFILSFRNLFSIESKDVAFKIFTATVIYYSIFKSVSFLIAVTNSYFWNKYWVFEKKTVKKEIKTAKISKNEFTQFFIIMFIGFLLNVSIASGVFKFVKPFARMNLDQWGIVSAAAATAVAMLWTFLGSKFVVFKK